MAKFDDDEPAGTYGLVPEIVSVSTAQTCETPMTDEKQRAIKGYINTLGPALRERYGKQPHYTAAQIHQTARDRMLSIDYLCWAYVLHCHPLEFESIHRSAGEVCDYAGMRGAIANSFFGGHTDFVTNDVTDVILAGASEAVASSGGILSWLGDVEWSGLLENIEL